MLVPAHTVREFANALKALLPVGAAWQWPINGLGDRIMLALAIELARFESFIQGVLDNAITTHQPATSLFTLAEYRRVANEALGNTQETMPRVSTRAGRVQAGQRLWSAAAEASTFNIDLLHVDLMYPSQTDVSQAGHRLYGERIRYALRVRYYDTVVNTATIATALQAFKQAHVALWFEDITSRAGNILYA